MFKSILKEVGKKGFVIAKKQVGITTDNISEEVKALIEHLGDTLEEALEQFGNQVIKEVDVLIQQRLESQSKTVDEFNKKELKKIKDDIVNELRIKFNEVHLASINIKNPNPFEVVEPLRHPTDDSAKGVYGIANNPNPTAGKEDKDG